MGSWNGISKAQKPRSECQSVKSTGAEVDSEIDIYIKDIIMLIFSTLRSIDKITSISTVCVYVYV